MRAVEKTTNTYKRSACQLYTASTTMKPIAVLLSLLLFACVHAPLPPQPHYIAFVKNELNLPIVLGTINIDPSNPALHPPAIRLGIDKTASHTSIYLSPQTVANLASLVLAQLSSSARTPRETPSSSADSPMAA